MKNTIQHITLDEAQGQAKELLQGAKAAIGMVPNLFGVMAHSPAVLSAYMGYNQALTTGVLTAKQREQIALVVAEANGCAYCLSAHSLMGKGAGLNPEEIKESRRGKSGNSETQGILTLALDLVKKRGQVGEQELVSAREAGLSDAQILETVAHVGLNILTNYTNNLVGTIIDFPVVEPELQLA